MNSPNDYYAVLGVEPQASASAIKSAFKKLALQYHPDVYHGEDAQERMRALLQAYQILGDPLARKEYDAQRRAPAGSGASSGRGSSFRSGSGSSSPTNGRFAFPDLRQTPT